MKEQVGFSEKHDPFGSWMSRILNTIEDTANILLKRVPNRIFKKLGPKYGKLMKVIAEYLVNLDQETISDFEKKGGS